MTQPSLFKRDHDAAQQYRDRVMRYLAKAKGWKLRREICEAFPELSDRAVRQIADDSKGAIISGQSGYRLTRLATTAEIDQAEAWLKAQARQMTERAVEIRLCRNRGGRAA